MGYNSAHVIIGDQSEKRFLTLSEASPQHRRCFAEQLVNIGDGSQTIGDIIICIADGYTSIADVSRMCLGHF